MKWSRASVLPRVSPRPKRGGLLSSSRASRLCRIKNGGLCGHCSRDLPLDRRLLFVAELTGQKWCGVRVMLPIGPNGLRFYRPARVFSELPPHEVGCGTWSRTTIGELMRLLWFSTFPRFEMVDRHGFAPCSPACEASDLLNDRAAQEKLVAGAGVEPAH